MTPDQEFENVFPTTRRSLLKSVAVGSALAVAPGHLVANAEAQPAFASRYSATKSVVAFGATGDGVTDDAPAIQACIDASLPGDVIEFVATGAAPNGGTTYLVGTDILLSEGRAYIGPLAPAGPNGVNIKYKDGTNGTAVLTSRAYASNGTTSAAPIRIENLNINANRAGNTLGSGIVLMNYNSTIAHCYVSSPAEAGIVLSDVNAAGTLITNTMVECRIEACKIYQPGTYGVWVKDTSGSGRITDGWCRELVISLSGASAIFIQRAAGWFITSNHVYTCFTDGFRLQNMWNTYVIGNETDGFANSESVATGIAFNFDGILAGRPSVIAQNVASANEIHRPANTYIYYRVRNSAANLTTFVQFVDNKAHQDSTGSASPTAMSLWPNAGTLNFYEVGSLMEGMPVNIGTPGTVHRQDLTGRTQGMVETISRDAIDPTAGSPAPSAGTLALTYFTADQTINITNLTSATRGTAQAGATLARMCLYAIDPRTGDGTCIARTASTPTLWRTTQTAYTNVIADDGQGTSLGSVKLIQGRRYAFGVLHVGSTTSPTLAGKTGIAGLTAGIGPSTRTSGYLTSQADVPASFAGTTIAANKSGGSYYYGRMT